MNSILISDLMRKRSVPEIAEEGLAELRMNPMEKQLTRDFKLVQKSYNAFKRPCSFAAERIANSEDRNYDVR